MGAGQGRVGSVVALSSTEEHLLLYHLFFERLGDVARAEPFCSVSMRRVEVLNRRLLPGIAAAPS